MGMAEIAEVLWRRHLRHNPANPHWPDRDRFVLSNGHGSMLQYALLHLTGYDLPIDELQALPPAAFEDAGPPGSRRHARRRDHHRPARPGPRQRGRHGARRDAARGANSTARATTIVDHHTYVFVGDGCLMEGISHEACSLAGTLGLGKLIAIYDDNGISIDGEVAGLVHRRHAGALRGLRLERDRATSTATMSTRSTRRSTQAQGGDRQADADLLQDDHRQGRAEQGGHRRGARRGAGREGSRRDARGARLELSAVRDSGRRLRGVGRARARRSAASATGTRRSPPIAAAHPELAAEFVRRMTRRAAGRLRSRRRAHCIAQAAVEKAETSPRARPRRWRSRRSRRCCRNCSAVRPTSPAPNLTNWKGIEARSTRDAAGQLHLLRRARIRHDARSERPCAARRLHPVRRHVPDVLRLRAQRAAHGRADEAALDLRLHARFDRPGRRRPDAPVGRARAPACA